MRMPELKSLAGDRGLRNYSRMSWLLFWPFELELFSERGQTSERGKARASDKTCVISQFSGTWVRPPGPFDGQ